MFDTLFTSSYSLWNFKLFTSLRTFVMILSMPLLVVALKKYVDLFSRVHMPLIPASVAVNALFSMMWSYSFIMTILSVVGCRTNQWNK